MTWNISSISVRVVSNALRIEELRAAAGLSKSELARRAGVNERTVRKIEAGNHQPSITTALKLADALGVDFLDLFADADL